MLRREQSSGNQRVSFPVDYMTDLLTGLRLGEFYDNPLVVSFVLWKRDSHVRKTSMVDQGIILCCPTPLSKTQGRSLFVLLGMLLAIAREVPTLKHADERSPANDPLACDGDFRHGCDCRGGG